MVSTLHTSRFSRTRFGEIHRSPRRKLTLVALLVALCIVVSPLITPANVIQTTFGGQDGADTLAIDSPTFTPEALSMTEDGFILKSSTQTAATDRSELSDIIAYAVESGDTLSTIAHRFGVSTDTIVWANDVKNPQSLKIGTILNILPVSGVAHATAKGDTLASIAKKYGVEADKIAKQNHLTTDDKLIAGLNLIIPGGKRSIEATSSTRYLVAKKGTYAAYRRPVSFDGAIVLENAEKDKNGKWMVKPVGGLYTTYFRPGHWGVDIGNRASPNIEASAAGTVVQSQCGWNGGYGCMVLIDHGDGYQTLYGHLAKMYVSVGEKVEKGTTIAKMGHTGNVHGPTGIHLHFEVIHNGRKVNPLAYYAE